MLQGRRVLTEHDKLCRALPFSCLEAALSLYGSRVDLPEIARTSAGRTRQFHFTPPRRVVEAN
jgi:hypothetical protein